MMKFYGTMVCKECLEARERLNAAGVLFDYVDISVSTGNMKEFLHLARHPQGVRRREEERAASASPAF